MCTAIKFILLFFFMNYIVGVAVDVSILIQNLKNIKKKSRNNNQARREIKNHFS